MTLAAFGHFKKVIYNDLDGDLVNLFRTISDETKRQKLFKILKWLPPSREVFEDDRRDYVKNGFSFSHIEDPIERARCTFYRHAFAFGGKIRSGGFSISSGDPDRIKEVPRYRNMLRKMVTIGQTFRKVVIENRHYSDVIKSHAHREDVVLFIDPPYYGTENYYSRTFTRADHAFLAEQLGAAKAKVVATYYDEPALRELYPRECWKWESISATKNSSLIMGNKAKTNEFVITKS